MKEGPLRRASFEFMGSILADDYLKSHNLNANQLEKEVHVQRSALFSLMNNVHETEEGA